MKKILSFLALVVGIFAVGNLVSAPRTTTNANKDNPPYVSKYGSELRNGSFISHGEGGNDVSCGGFKGVALVTITAGDVLIGVSSTPYARGVSKAASDALATTIGVAHTSAVYGAAVEVCTYGIAEVLADPGLVITYGMFLVGSAASAGAVCGISQSAAGGDFARGVSQTAIIGRSLQVKTTSTTNKFLTVQLLNH